jgi:UPF0288 family protein (methanogenesis marker protein 3)
MDSAQPSMAEAYAELELAMIKWKTSELALLKGIEIQRHPLMAGACTKFEPAMIRWRTPELIGLKRVRRKCSDLRCGSII